MRTGGFRMKASGKRRVRRIAFTSVAAISAILFSLVLPASGTTLTGSTFEIDGNLIVDKTSAPANTDWATTGYVDCTSGSEVNCSTDLTRSQLDNAFGQGSKENTPSPTVVPGSIPNNKSDLK